MLLYYWGLIVEKNLYSYTEKLGVLRKYGGKTLYKKTQIWGAVGVGRSENLSCWLLIPSGLACERHETHAMLYLLHSCKGFTKQNTQRWLEGEGQAPQLCNSHRAANHPTEPPLIVQHVPILNSWSSWCEREERGVILFLTLLSVSIFPQRLCVALVYFQNAWEVD